ncbi:hypothetical protein DSCW_07570 [Desulfosarcina widdelii]|uniref:Uncharacterized protein n=1 Tax=Desulfosarcina widdelii TaxID=947919 RepID=A0A5K7YY96_9BACT|nr:hypothetical protein [Desulfosarcina widdelii]BBO73340.1 hypothetical protein DSCW_07570 [Desulfosarcina widdelii]
MSDQIQFDKEYAQEIREFLFEAWGVFGIIESITDDVCSNIRKLENGKTAIEKRAMDNIENLDLIIPMFKDKARRLANDLPMIPAKGGDSR